MFGNGTAWHVSPIRRQGNKAAQPFFGRYSGLCGGCDVNLGFSSGPEVDVLWTIVCTYVLRTNAERLLDFADLARGIRHYFSPQW